MPIDQKALSEILDLINTNVTWQSRYPREAWLDSFKTELIKLCGFVLKPGVVKPEVMVEILEMYPNDTKESAKKFADSKGLMKVY